MGTSRRARRSSNERPTSSLELRETDPSNRQLPTKIILARYSLARSCERQAHAEPDVEARRRLLARARDAYHAIVRHYEQQGKGHGGFARQVRQRYETLRSELGDG